MRAVAADDALDELGLAAAVEEHAAAVARNTSDSRRRRTAAARGTLVVRERTEASTAAAPAGVVPLPDVPQIVVHGLCAEPVGIDVDPHRRRVVAAVVGQTAVGDAAAAIAAVAALGEVVLDRAVDELRIGVRPHSRSRRRGPSRPSRRDRRCAWPSAPTPVPPLPAMTELLRMHAVLDRRAGARQQDHGRTVDRRAVVAIRMTGGAVAGVAAVDRGCRRSSPA